LIVGENFCLVVESESSLASGLSSLSLEEEP